MQPEIDVTAKDQLKPNSQLSLLPKHAHLTPDVVHVCSGVLKQTSAQMIMVIELHCLIHWLQRCLTNSDKTG